MCWITFSAKRNKFKRVKFGGGQAYNRSGDLAAVMEPVKVKT
jgi:hypothetical protein